MEEAQAHLTKQEVRDLVFSILDGITAVLEREPVGATWVNEMYDWCDLLLSRIYDTNGGNED